jgi:hypothetical protein
LGGKPVNFRARWSFVVFNPARGVIGKIIGGGTKKLKKSAGNGSEFCYYAE